MILLECHMHDVDRLSAVLIDEVHDASGVLLNQVEAVLCNFEINPQVL